MPLRLEATRDGFSQSFEAFLSERREAAVDVRDDVARIVARVKDEGDAALIELTAKYDRLDLTADSLRVSAAEISAARESCSAEAIAALETARTRIIAYHERQKPEGFDYVDDTGVRLGSVWHAVSAAGLYVPGGTAAYPSSVLMNAVPARVAGVERLVMVVPSPDGVLNPLVLAAADIAGVDEVYRVGGAQAVAALAHGTETIAPVDKIVGPGNAYVAEAKRQVFGVVGIDMIAGPSEILVIADKDNDPDWVALDLLSQAEHDSSAQSILITNNSVFADEVSSSVEFRLTSLERRDIAAASWQDNGAIITVRDWGEAAALSDRIAPEHLQLCIEEPRALAANIRHAGAIFLGKWTPEAIGDYIAGPNHVLPTARSARFSSGLGVLDFMKRTTMTELTPEAMRVIGPAAERLARSESLEAHGLSVGARLERLNRPPE